MKPLTRWATRARAVTRLVRQFSFAPVRILYGSQTGTGQQFASQLVESLAAAEPPIPAVATDLRDFDSAESLLSGDASAPPTVFIMSCFGRGDPSDSAKRFVASMNDDAIWAQSPKRELLRTLPFAVFGLGSSKTHAEYYNVVGRRLDARLDALGAERILPRGEGDDSGCIEVDFEAWASQLTARLQALGASSSVKKGDGEDAAGQAATPKPLYAPNNSSPYNSDGPCPLIVKSAGPAPCDMATDNVTPAATTNCGTSSQHGTGVRSLASLADAASMPLAPYTITQRLALTPGEFRPCYELRLTAKTAAPYTAGDHIGIMPQNSATNVERLCARLRWDPEYEFSVEAHGNSSSTRLPFTGVGSVRDVLTYRTALGAAVSPAMLRMLSSSCSSSSEAAALRALAEPDQYVSRVRDQLLRLSDVLARFPSAKVPLDRFLASTPSLLPRYYSISSSPKLVTTPGTLDVTFRHLRVPRSDGTVFEGACTSFLAAAAPGDDLLLAMRPSHFRLPSDPATPIVMVAGGVGITPFRSFLQDRLADANGSPTSKFGPAMLLYGCRDAADRIYADVAAEALAAGALTCYDVAYAAPSKATLAITPRPRLAHELLAEHASDVWEAIHRGGIVYVCGGAAGFGESIVAALQGVLVSAGGMEAPAARQYVSAMLASDRLLEDLAD